MIFEAKKDKLFSTIFYGSFLGFGIVLAIILKGDMSENTLGFVVDVSIIMLLVWIWYVTDYKIENTILAVRLGPFKRNIPIKSITKIELGKTKWIGNSYGLSMKGLIIHYSKNDIVYITPENTEKFCKQLKLINKKIVLDKK